jgi:hypothetical protein
VFHIFPTGLFCSRCDKPIGCGIESVRRHMRSSHPVLWGNIDNFSKFHATILSATNQLKALQLPMAVKSGDQVLRFKCVRCHHSYGSLQNFNKHARKSTGLCTGSVPISTRFATFGCGRFVEAALLGVSTSTLSSVIDLPAADSDTTLPFRIVEKAISNYVPEDKDVHTFVSLFTPLIAMDTSFELTMCGYIDQYKNPPAPYEYSLQTLLVMGENWLLERARHEVSLVPGNFRASLLQFDSQDMGEVSQNLTYNFRHRERTLLPELKYFLSFIWRSQLPFLESFRRGCNVR